MSIYLDTSVLVSLYVPEKYSEAMMERLLNNKDGIIISRLAEVEFISAISMKQRLKELTAKQSKVIIALLQQHLNETMYERFYLTDEIFTQAGEYLSKSALKLRTLDALHLSAAYLSSAPLITADKVLAEAAKKLKIKSELI